MLYEFDRGSAAAEATKDIHAAYGEKAVGSSTLVDGSPSFVLKIPP
jgi:hypothetical protein